MSSPIDNVTGTPLSQPSPFAFASPPGGDAARSKRTPFPPAIVTVVDDDDSGTTVVTDVSGTVVVVVDVVVTGRVVVVTRGAVVAGTVVAGTVVVVVVVVVGGGSTVKPPEPATVLQAAPHTVQLPRSVWAPTAAVPGTVALNPLVVTPGLSHVTLAGVVQLINVPAQPALFITHE